MCALGGVLDLPMGQNFIPFRASLDAKFIELGCYIKVKAYITTSRLGPRTHSRLRYL